MKPKPASCVSCPLYKDGLGFCGAEGEGSLGVMIVGEASGAAEAQDGLPFRPYAESGSVLEQVFRRLGYSRSQFAICNVVSCRPPSNLLAGEDYEQAAISNCRGFLDANIARYKPRAILALGGIATRTLTEMTGARQGPTAIRGFVLDAPRYPGIPVISSYHPAFLRRGKMAWLGVLIRDLELAVQVARNGPPSCLPKRYIEQPTLAQAQEFLEASKHAAHIAVDIETAWSHNADEDEAPDETVIADGTILTVQFSLAPGTGISFQWTAEFQPIVREILALDIPKLFFNGWHFDIPKLRENGCVVAGRVDDIMWCLRGDNKVRLATGETAWIRDIVENRQAVEVLSLDSLNRPIKTKIVEWHKHDVPNQKWLSIKSDGTRFPVICTPEHKIRTIIGGFNYWTRADEIKIGDRVILPAQGADDVIHGHLLGDGYYTGTSLRFCGSAKQLAYRKDLAKYFGVRLHQRTAKIGSGLGAAKEHQEVRFTVTCSKSWQTKFYVNNVKRFIAPPTSRAIAIWLMDDGSYSQNKRNGKKYGHERITFPLAGFNNPESAVAWARQRFGAESVGYHPNDKTLRISRQGLIDLAAAVAPYVHPSMDYKLPIDFRGKYNSWMDAHECQTALIENIKVAAPRAGFNTAARYCLTVEHPSHLFLVNGGAVSNCWHHAQPDLPRNLQFVASQYCPEFGPWKHLAGANLAWYGAADVDILQRIWPKLRADMEAKDIWRGYERHVRQLWPLLERMSERGLPVSAESQASFRAELDEVLARVDCELQEIYPEELKELHPPKGFVREPADTTGMRKIIVTATRKEKVLCACVDQETGLIQGWTKKASERCKDCKGTGLVRQVVTGPVARWAEVLPFKPSQQQLVKYMHFKKHQVPKAIGSDQDTTSKLFIERMAKRYKDPLYPKLLEYRSTQKMLSTYLDGWAPGPDGLVHATFKFSPATGQLAASAPNVLTLPTEQKAGKLGLRFRETLQAKPGYVLVEADMSGFHTSTFAFESKDKDYWRLANTVGDPHSFLTAVLLGLGKVEEMLAWDDEKLRAFLAKIKKEHKLIRDGQAKPAILGYALGLGANKLYELNRYNPETGAGFKTKSAAGVLIDTLRATFPRGYAYQQEVRLKAHLQTYLLNPHGFIRYFWDVMHRDGRSGETILGEQAEAAIAFNVQADAHGHLKDAILRMEAKGWLEKYGLCNIVHDSVVFHARKELLEELCYNVLSELQRPSEVLVCPIIAPGGLAVGAEAKFGPDMAHMETWKG